MTTLYREFKGAPDAGTGTHLIGFADDTNILAWFFINIATDKLSSKTPDFYIIG